LLIFSVKICSHAIGWELFLLTFYFYKAPAALIEMPIDFESTTLTYPWQVLKCYFRGHSSFSSGPDKTGNNLSNKVLKIKPSGV
jgi:hypothetical protein